ncbi:unnamed protein product, partial [Staurois parvus]
MVFVVQQSPTAQERVSPLSGGERTSPAPVPSAALPKPETVSWKPELGFTMRLGAQVQLLHHLCSPLAARRATQEFLLAFGERASGFFKPWVT